MREWNRAEIMNMLSFNEDDCRPPSPITRPPPTHSNHTKHKNSGTGRRNLPWPRKGKGKGKKGSSSADSCLGEPKTLKKTGKRKGDYQMQFLGIKWRFLRSDLEKETLPSVAKRPVAGSEPATNHSVAKLAVLDTYLQHLPLAGVRDLESLDSFSAEQCPSSSAPGPLSELSSAPDSPSAATASTDFTSADVIQALRNMQIFQHAPPPRASRLSTLAGPVAPDAVPTPPPGPKPWASAAGSSSSTACSTATAPTKTRVPACRLKQQSKMRQKLSTPGARATAADPNQVKALPIARAFRQFAVENGVRVPSCVSKSSE